MTEAILNIWQRRAQERYVRGALLAAPGGYYAALPGTVLQACDLPLPAILEHLAYEQQQCDRCDGSGKIPGFSAIDPDIKRICPTCDGTGFSPDYRKAQEWAERLGLEDADG